MTGTGFIIGLKIDYHGIAALRGRASGTYPTKIDSRSPPPPFRSNNNNSWVLSSTAFTALCYGLWFLNLRPHSPFRLGIAIGFLSRMLFMYWRFAIGLLNWATHPVIERSTIPSAMPLSLILVDAWNFSHCFKVGSGSSCSGSVKISQSLVVWSSGQQRIYFTHTVFGLIRLRETKTYKRQVRLFLTCGYIAQLVYERHGFVVCLSLKISAFSWNNASFS